MGCRRTPPPPPTYGPTTVTKTMQTGSTPPRPSTELRRSTPMHTLRMREEQTRYAGGVLAESRGVLDGFDSEVKVVSTLIADSTTASAHDVTGAQRCSRGPIFL